MSAFSQDDLQVAEYVLGTLDAPERDALTARLREEPALRAQRDAWERRLAPLQGLVAPQAPPAALWRRILQRIDTPRPRRGGLWGIPGLAGALASAVLLLAIWLWPEPPAQTQGEWHNIPLAVSDAPLWQARWSTAEPEHLHIEAVAATGADAEHDHELWLIREGDPRPRSLGLLPRHQGTAKTLRWPGPQPGLTLAISTEPRGGSRQEGPSGPVVAVLPLDEA